MKTNLNTENDSALRKGSSAVYRDQKNKDILKKSLKNEETKNALIDFIFGNSDKSPISRNVDGLITSVVGSKESIKSTHNKEFTYGLDTSVSIETGKKLCKCCGIEKDASMFYLMRNAKDGLQHHCIECQKERLRKEK